VALSQARILYQNHSGDYPQVILTIPVTCRTPYMNGSDLNRGLQYFKLNGNQTKNDKYWQKINFLLFAKCLKMFRTAGFYADFKFVDAGF
jgi:hypothetical protein